MHDIVSITGALVGPAATATKTTATAMGERVVSVSEAVTAALNKAPLSLTLNLETAECIAQVDRTTK